MNKNKCMQKKAYCAECDQAKDIFLKYGRIQRHGVDPLSTIVSC